MRAVLKMIQYRSRSIDGIMTACLGIDKIVRSKPFARGPYKADSIAYYVQL